MARFRKLAVGVGGVAIGAVSALAFAMHVSDLFELGPGLLDDESGATNIVGDGVPAKNDLTNTYAYAVNQNGHLMVYAGMEREDPSGDSHNDIEFFQNTIALDKTPPCGADLTSGPGDKSPCEIIGTKTPGDILVS